MPRAVCLWNWVGGLGSGASHAVLAFSELGKQSKDHALLWEPSEQAGARGATKESHSLSDDDKTTVQ